jgi:hypothetical protein
VTGKVKRFLSGTVPLVLYPAVAAELSARNALHNFVHYTVQAGPQITADTWFEF